MPPKFAANGRSPLKGKGPAVSHPPPSPASTGLAHNGSKKKKKKKGKGKATSMAEAGDADFSSHDMFDDDDDLPALEPVDDTHSTLPHSRTGLSPDLESVHLSTTATLSASARGKPAFNMSSAQQAEILDELTRKIELDPAAAMAEEVRESLEALPGGMRSFVQTALAGMAGLGLGENEVKKRTLYAIAQQMLSGGLSSFRTGGNENVGGGNGNRRSFQHDIPESVVSQFERMVGKGVATTGQTQLQANVMLSHGFLDDEGGYREGDFSEDEVDEDVEDMEDMPQMRRSITRNNAHYSVSFEEEFIPGAFPANPPEQYDYTAKNKKKKKKKKNAEPVQPVPPPNPTPPPARHGVTHTNSNPVPAVPPSSTPMPAPRTTNPPPSSRAAGKQPMSYPPTSTTANNLSSNPPRSARAAAKAPAPPQNYNAHNHPHHHPSPPSSNASAPQKHRPPAGTVQNNPNVKNNKIWSTNTSEERERIKEFWLGLGEEERRALVKIEKETVLKKMKEQQKHSCTCAVCGRKRHAIEEELEVLYDAYYEELEQYANYQQQYASSGGAIPPPPGPGPFPGSVELDKNGLIIGPGGKTHAPQPRKNTLANGKKVQDPDYDDDEPEPDDYDDEEYEDEEEEEEEEEEDEIDAEDDMDVRNRGARRGVGRDRGRVPNGKANGRDDFFSFGSSFTVAGPGNILTVADDLLKNDGQKFLEMMEQLAERRMQREEEAAIDVEEDSEEDEDEDGDEGEEDEDEEDEEDEEEEKMTEEQKMEERKRMFSIFAARMFEQRVLQAYREKVAQERQLQLLRELEDEDKLTKEKEAKKAKENQKKKDKKRQQKLAKEEEKAAKAAERAAEEAALKERQRQLEEEQRKKREEERLKREEQRRALEEEKRKRDEERRKRLAEDKEREAERERKRKEKEEKVRVERREREEKERRVREEREAKLAAEKAEKERIRKELQEKEERERRLAKEKEEKEREAREKEKEAKERERQAALQLQQQQQQRIAAAAPPFTSPSPSPYTSATSKSPRSSSAPSGSRQQPPGNAPKKFLSRTSSSIAPAVQAMAQSTARPPMRPPQQQLPQIQPQLVAAPQQVQGPLFPSAPSASNLSSSASMYSQNGPMSAPVLSPRLGQFQATVPPTFPPPYGLPVMQAQPSMASVRPFAQATSFESGLGRGLAPAAPIGSKVVGIANPLSSPTAGVIAPPIRRPSLAADTSAPGPISRPAPIARPHAGDQSTSGSGSGTASPSRRTPSPKVLGSSALANDNDEIVVAPNRRAASGLPPVGTSWHSPRNSLTSAVPWAMGSSSPANMFPSPAPRQPPWSATPGLPQDWPTAQLYGMQYANPAATPPPHSGN